MSCVPKIAIVLGSGLGECIKEFKLEYKVPFSDIPYFPCTTVSEHRGMLLFGKIKEVPIVMMQGRVHFYEGYDAKEVVRPIRILKILGIEQIVLTNSSGAINSSYIPGDIVIVQDHIATFVPNPLQGENIEELGTRFPDMSQIYDSQLQQLMLKVANQLSIQLKDGVYLQSAGPSFESPAEIKMYQHLGADMVGMSTACEAIAARHAGIRVVALSCISNMASGISEQALSMEEVVINAKKMGNKLADLLLFYVQQFSKEGDK